MFVHYLPAISAGAAAVVCPLCSATTTTILVKFSANVKIEAVQNTREENIILYLLKIYLTKKMSYLATQTMGVAIIKAELIRHFLKSFLPSKFSAIK